MKRVVVGPFNRVEGDLEVALDVHDGAVRSARVGAPLFRGFEQILVGRAPLDALVFVPRICGACSVAQSIAASRALATAMRVVPPRNGRLVGDLVQACENVADHFTHFHLSFMPDFARPAYRGRRWFAAAEQRFRSLRGTAVAEALVARARFLEIMGILAGKWPHTLAIRPGGVSRGVERSEKVQLLITIRAFRSFLEQTFFGDELERVGVLDSAAALDAWRDARAPESSSFRLFLEAAADLDLARLGRGPDAFLSYGAFLDGPGPRFAAGVFGADVRPLDERAISEDVSHAWLSPDVPRHPREGTTRPEPDKPGAYTWCKAPRLDGRVVEVGALARQVVVRHPLARDLVATGGGNVFSRVVARLLEIALLVPAMEGWALALDPGEPFCTEGAMPDEAEGVGLVEAARGALGHWLAIRNGRIHRYQIVAPTTWNFSPRDADGRPGALEQALVGCPAGEGVTGAAVQHVVRSFDPCMVCTVH